MTSSVSLSSRSSFSSNSHPTPPSSLKHPAPSRLLQLALSPLYYSVRPKAVGPSPSLSRVSQILPVLPSSLLSFCSWTLLVYSADSLFLTRSRSLFSPLFSLVKFSPLYLLPSPIPRSIFARHSKTTSVFLPRLASLLLLLLLLRWSQVRG